MTRALKLYAALWRIGLQDAMQYRAESFIWILFDVVPPVMMLFFWNVAYDTTDEVAGFNRAEMLGYTLGILVLRNLISVQIEWTIDEEVRQGTLSTYLVRPVSPWLLWFFNALGWRIWRTIIVTPILAIAMLFLAPSLSIQPLTSIEMAAFGLSLILAYFVCFFLKLTLGFTAFWLTNIQGVISLFDVAVYLFGGILIPLALLPEPLQAFAQVLPLQAIFSFPLMVLLGRIQGDALVLGLAVQAGWILGLAGLAGTMWRSGLRRYEAVGG